MSSSTSAAVSALLDVVVVSVVTPERAEFELTPTPTPAAAIGFHRKVLTGSLPPQRTAVTTTWCGGGEPGVTQVVAERAGGPAEFKTLPNQDTGVRRRVGEEYYVRYDEVLAQLAIIPQTLALVLSWLLEIDHD
ncbi:hypothetical protein JB92DRAFT_2832257 [Gautieria morchelliformis]|nr:hypothetical protein JB92DRAFT_2832257 [Gautieria morchelliformis]